MSRKGGAREVWDRLAEWEEELRINRYSMAHLAPRAIKLICDDLIEVWGVDPKDLEHVAGRAGRELT